MEFLFWHYGEGLNIYIKKWLSYFDWIIHYFSLPLLIKTLFAPWKRLVIVDKKPGFDFKRFFETVTFNLISRIIGAIVRFTLFWVGLVLFVVIFFGGISGLIIWMTLPFLGIPTFLRVNKHPAKFIKRLLFEIKDSKGSEIKRLFDNEAGGFVLEHTGLESSELEENAKLDSKILAKLKGKSFEELLNKLVENKVWKDEFFRKKGLSKNDIVTAASWWDNKMAEEASFGGYLLGKPGLGLELLFGYTPNLNQYSIDLSAPQDFSQRLIGREEVVSRMERALTGGSSVVLIGDPGVGKRTVVLEFAHRASAGKLGKEMTYRRILEFDYNFLLSEATDLNLKKAKLSTILEEAAAAGNIILMVRDIHRLTNPEVEGYDFTDIFEDHLEKKELKVIAVSTPTEYERFVAPNMRLRKHLETVRVNPPTKDEAMLILIEWARRWETMKDVTITVPALRKILDESDRYITETPFPEKALELLDALIMYKDQVGGKVITTDDANAILAEKTGISFARLTETEKKKLGNLEEIIHERLIDQDTAVSLIAKSLRAKTVGVAKEKRPIGSFLFLGPTGVGKTETAKVLARVYYGSEENILRFDMAEYAGKEGLERLIGSVSKNQPGALTTAIKNQPASLLLLDEFEKASREIYNLFLALLDEGSITDAFGKKISGKHLFVIGTSNAGAEYIRQIVSKDTKGEKLQKKVLDHVLEKEIFTPELLNRFDGVVVYEPLRSDDLVKIAKILLNELSKNLLEQNIYLEISNEAAVKLSQDGYDPAFGARPMKRIINLIIGDVLGKAILKGDISEGDRIKLIAGTKKDEYTWEKTK